MSFQTQKGATRALAAQEFKVKVKIKKELNRIVYKRVFNFTKVIGFFICILLIVIFVFIFK